MAPSAACPIAAMITGRWTAISGKNRPPPFRRRQTSTCTTSWSACAKFVVSEASGLERSGRVRDVNALCRDRGDAAKSHVQVSCIPTCRPTAAEARASTNGIEPIPGPELH